MLSDLVLSHCEARTLFALLRTRQAETQSIFGQLIYIVAFILRWKLLTFVKTKSSSVMSAWFLLLALLKEKDLELQKNNRTGPKPIFCNE